MILSLSNPTIQKLASTAYSRWFARNSTKAAAQFGKKTPQDYMQLYGKVNKKTGKLDVTPKMIAKAEYEIAKKNSGKTGRDAFRPTIRNHITDSRGKKIRPLSKGDALGNQLEKKVPHPQGDYATEMAMRRRYAFQKPKGNKDAKGRLKGSISKDKKITRNKKRKNNVIKRGVGDLKVGTAKEMHEQYKLGKRIENLTPEQLARKRKNDRINSRKRKANKAMDKILEKHNLIKKATYLVKQAQLQTSTVKPTRPVVSGFTKSMDKVVGQGAKTIRAGRLTNATPAVKNVKNAIKTTKGMTSGGGTLTTPLAKTAASRLTKHLAKMLNKNPKVEATKAYKKLKKNFADHDVSGTAYNNELKKTVP